MILKKIIDAVGVSAIRLLRGMASLRLMRKTKRGMFGLSDRLALIYPFVFPLKGEKPRALLIRPFMILTVVFFVFSLSSCVKDDFDAPPADGEDPDITANTTIAQLKQLFTASPVQITDSLVIQGVVTSSDKAGNFYKALVIQDATAGISIRLDQTDLYADYPIGRRIFVKCKNLWLGDYGNLVQLGGALDDSDPQNPEVTPIPAALIGNYLLKGKYNNQVTPITLTIDQLDNLYQNMLIRLNDVEFAVAEIGKTYADAVNESSENRTLTDCNGNSVILRSSGFAQFAGDTLPEGNGTLTAIFSVFTDDFQLIINDVTDVRFDSARCTPAGGEGILGIRHLYAGSDVAIGSGVTIKGIVISDRANGNFDSRNLVIQDLTGGIVVRFTAAHNFNLGDEVEVDVSGQTLTEYNGLIEIDGAPNANATKTGTGSITPRTATISQITSNSSTWESTLVKVNAVTLTGGSGQYSGTVTMTDAEGTLDLYTRTGASFATTSYPTGSVSITGVLGDFNREQINIRSTADVQ